MMQGPLSPSSGVARIGRIPFDDDLVFAVAIQIGDGGVVALYV